MPYMVLSLKDVSFRQRQELLSAHEEQEADKFADVVSFSTSVCLSPLLGVHFWSILDSNSINFAITNFQFHIWVSYTTCLPS